MKHSTFIILPAFNESQVIRETVEPLLDKPCEIVVVDDGSSDDTHSRVKDLPVHYLKHMVNIGQGAALQTGMSFALRHHGEFMVHFDSDGQHNPDEIEEMVDVLKRDEADVVLGSRFLRAEDKKEIPFVRRILLKNAIFVNRLFTGLLLTDAHNGFRAFNRKAAEKIVITENRMAHATEILMLIKRNNLRFREIPTHVKYTGYARKKGQSSLNSIIILMDIILKKMLK